MNRLLSFSLFCLLALLITSCQPTASTAENTDSAVTEDNLTEETATPKEDKPAVETAVTNSKLLITSKSFMGIQPGDNIIDHQAYLKKDLLQTGEGDFEIFQINDPKGTSVGYLHPDPNDEELVGMIVVTSPEARTEDGLSVGMTLGDLRSKLTDYEIHGSEIEGYTAAYHGQFSYQLDSRNWEYDLDASTIADDVKILEITLRD